MHQKELNERSPLRVLEQSIHGGLGRGNIGVIVVPQQVALPKAHEAFDDDGHVTDEKRRASVLDVGRRVAELAERIARELIILGEPLGKRLYCG